MLEHTSSNQYKFNQNTIQNYTTYDDFQLIDLEMVTSTICSIEGPLIFGIIFIVPHDKISTKYFSLYFFLTYNIGMKYLFDELIIFFNVFGESLNILHVPTVQHRILYIAHN